MSLSKERILYLLNTYSGDTANEAEEQELFAWVNESSNHELLQQHIRKLIDQYEPGEIIHPADWEYLCEKILDKSIVQKKHTIHKISRLRWSSAAAIILLSGAGVYLYLNQPSSKTNITTVITQKPVNNDVPAPVNSKAVLTLADGSKIELDSISNGTFARQGSVQIVKQADGQIAYNGLGNEDLYNTLHVPRGSRVVTIKLSDGTQVWLNSESSLRYPASFKGTERKVEITGEAYFEVTHNPAMPFIVKKDAMEIKVFGTHFNMNTYEDEGVNKVTLLEGSIKVSISNYQSLLKPGQQAQIKDDIKLVNGVDVEGVVAWKNGQFQFGEKADLNFIMRKIARWYDVDVEYEGRAIHQRFGGEMPMNSKLSQVLEILRTSGVNFTIEGKKVIVKS
jgi:ferric-dicitrate binding protein FerR (iron transport regulator)